MPPIKKFTLALAVFVVAGVATWALYYTPPPASAPMQTHNKTTVLRIGTTTLEAEVADTPTLRELGLGGRTHLPEGSGMWFVFEADGLWAFWMKDTLIPLDMVWVSATGTVVSIAHDVQPGSYPQAYAPTAPARYVLEVPGGFTKRHGIAEGDLVLQK